MDINTFECDKCKFRKQCNQPLQGKGNLDSKLLIVFKEPSELEDKHGAFIDGSRSTWLLEILKNQYKLTFNDFYATYALRCFHQDKPQKRELSSCKENLDNLINQMPNLKLVLSVGGTALNQFEGSNAVLKLRLNVLGLVTHNGRNLYSVVVKDPYTITQKDSAYAKEREYLDLISQLNFFKQVYDRSDSGKFETVYDYRVAQSEKEAFDYLDFLYDSKQKHIAIDFETGGIMAYGAESVCISFSHENGQAITIPFLQKKNLPKEQWYSIKGKNGSNFTIKWYFEPWFSKSFKSDFYKKTKNLFASEEETGYTDKPMITSYHAQFETSVISKEAGYILSPKKQQIMDTSYLHTWDGLLGIRLCLNSLNSIKLENIIRWVFPLESDSDKKGITEILTKNQIDNTGFALAAIKDERDPDYWNEKFNMPTKDILFSRANLDASIERRLVFVIDQLLNMRSETQTINFLNELNQSDLWI